MKILIIIGARPNYMKVINLLKYPNVKLLHTGQHFSKEMSDDLLDDLEIEPDYQLNLMSSMQDQKIGEMIMGIGNIINTYKPDFVIVIGDVDSTLAGAIAANKCGVKVAHIESGLRSYDKSMPEEVNRVLVDHISDILFVTEEDGIINLKREGISKSYLVGDTLIEYLNSIKDKIKTTKGSYALMTMHRPVNVDTEEGLENIRKIINIISRHYKVIFPAHPRTLKNINKYGLKIETISPVSYHKFQSLLSGCALVITDSGGIQVEASFWDVPCIVWRKKTERLQALYQGTVTLCNDLDYLVRLVSKIKKGKYKHSKIEFNNATDKIISILNTYE